MACQVSQGLVDDGDKLDVLGNTLQLANYKFFRPIQTLHII
jgi:hypothetical protein